MTNRPDSVTLPQIDIQSLAFDLAQNYLGEKRPLPDILARHALTLAQFQQLQASPSFNQALRAYGKELKTSGASFRLKARVQAEELLKTNWRIIHDVATPPATAIKAIENTVRWADLEPKKDVDPNTRPSITVNIDLGTSQEKVVIDAAHATALQSP